MSRRQHTMNVFNTARGHVTSDASNSPLARSTRPPIFAFDFSWKRILSRRRIIATVKTKWLEARESQFGAIG
jgi:hypothetical protein